MKTQRNSRCWCGSGKKYKQCHEKWDDRYNILKLEGHTMPARSLIKSPEDLRLIRKAAAINNGVLDLVAERIHAGMTTEDINTLVHNIRSSMAAYRLRSTMRAFPRASAPRSTTRSAMASRAKMSSCGMAISSTWM